MKLKKSFLFFLFICSALLTWLPSANAQVTFFEANCTEMGCHNITKPTCYGCHQHGGSQNFSVTLDRADATYERGAPIKITIDGGASNVRTASDNWVRLQISEGGVGVFAESKGNCLNGLPTDPPGCGNVGWPVTINTTSNVTGTHQWTLSFYGRNAPQISPAVDPGGSAHVFSSKQTFNVNIVEPGAGGGGGNSKPKSSGGAFGWELLLLGIPMFLRRKLT